MPPKFQGDPPAGPTVVLWHRTDLRLHDSPALHAALSLFPSSADLPPPGRLIPLWTWDPHYVYASRVGPNRWKFLVECQRNLSEGYARLTEGRQKLHVVREAPVTVLPKLWAAWGVDVLVFERDTDAYARERDQAVVKLAEQAGVRVVAVHGRTLFDSDELVKANGGKPTMSMAQVLKASEKIGGGLPNRPLAVPDGQTVPGPGDLDLSAMEHEHEVPSSDTDVNAAYRSTNAGHGQYQSVMGPNKDFGIPTLEEMGIDPKSATTPHQGGETVALKMLADYCQDEEYVGTFEKPKSAPTAVEPASTTLLSPHLHFGSLSVRQFWWDVQDVIQRRQKARKHVSDIPVNLPGQLLFRDMYFGAQASLGYRFAQTQGNPVCRFIDWHLQSNYSSTPVGEHLLDGTYAVDDDQAEEWFRRWKEGRTGFPWIDALMRQLKQEGWIHHLGRHAVACFLTRGGCYVSWERGAEVFEEWLIDHETACNVGNWMWLSCTAFFSQFFRCYSPIAFGKKWDGQGDFVRRYVPELAKFSDKFIYEPHKAPVADQKAWGCVITGDGTETKKGSMRVYPNPMFDFNERRQICIDRMKNAYDKKIYGDNPSVMDGSWTRIFKDKDERAGTKHETTGMAERPKKKQKVEEKPDSKERSGKKQGTLDAHLGNKKNQK